MQFRARNVFTQLTILWHLVSKATNNTGVQDATTTPAFSPTKEYEDHMSQLKLLIGFPDANTAKALAIEYDNVKKLLEYLKPAANNNLGEGAIKLISKKMDQFFQAAIYSEKLYKTGVDQDYANCYIEKNSEIMTLLQSCNKILGLSYCDVRPTGLMDLLQNSLRHLNHDAKNKANIDEISSQLNMMESIAESIVTDYVITIQDVMEEREILRKKNVKNSDLPVPMATLKELNPEQYSELTNKINDFNTALQRLNELCTAFFASYPKDAYERNRMIFLNAVNLHHYIKNAAELIKPCVEFIYGNFTGNDFLKFYDFYRGRVNGYTLCAIYFTLPKEGVNEFIKFLREGTDYDSNKINKDVYPGKLSDATKQPVFGAPKQILSTVVSSHVGKHSERADIDNDSASVDGADLFITQEAIKLPPKQDKPISVSGDNQKDQAALKNQAVTLVATKIAVTSEKPAGKQPTSTDGTDASPDDGSSPGSAAVFIIGISVIVVIAILIGLWYKNSISRREND